MDCILRLYFYSIILDLRGDVGSTGMESTLGACSLGLAAGKPYSWLFYSLRLMTCFDALLRFFTIMIVTMDMMTFFSNWRVRVGGPLQLRSFLSD